MALLLPYFENILAWLKYFLSFSNFCRIFVMSHCKSDVAHVAGGFFMYSNKINLANPLQIPSGMRDALAGVTCGFAFLFNVKLQGGCHV